MAIDSGLGGEMYPRAMAALAEDLVSSGAHDRQPGERGGEGEVRGATAK